MVDVRWLEKETNHGNLMKNTESDCEMTESRIQYTIFDKTLESVQFRISFKIAV